VVPLTFPKLKVSILSLVCSSHHYIQLTLSVEVNFDMRCFHQNHHQDTFPLFISEEITSSGPACYKQPSQITFSSSPSHPLQPNHNNLTLVMKLAILIISTAALALATPIIPTMVYDLPSVTTPTDEPHLPAATTTDDLVPIIPRFPNPVIEPRPWWPYDPCPNP
jgi:hypothetical protein